MTDSKNYYQDVLIRNDKFPELSLFERIAAQVQKGQYFRNGGNAVLEVMGVKDGYVIMECRKILKGKRVFKLEIFAQLLNNKYFTQIPDPNLKIEWELNKTLGLNRFHR